VGYTENYAIDRKLSRRKQPRISDGKEEKIYTLDHQRKYNTGLVAKQAVLFPFKKNKQYISEGLQHLDEKK